jgi:hypothetical protein
MEQWDHGNSLSPGVPPSHVLPMALQETLNGGDVDAPSYPNTWVGDLQLRHIIH